MTILDDLHAARVATSVDRCVAVVRRRLEAAHAGEALAMLDRCSTSELVALAAAERAATPDEAMA